MKKQVEVYEIEWTKITVGDLLHANKEGIDVTEGEFYLIVDLCDGKAVITDDVGEEHAITQDWIMTPYSLYDKSVNKTTDFIRVNSKYKDEWGDKLKKNEIVELFDPQEKGDETIVVINAKRDLVSYPIELGYDKLGTKDVTGIKVVDALIRFNEKYVDVDGNKIHKGEIVAVLAVEEDGNYVTKSRKGRYVIFNETDVDFRFVGKVFKGAI